ncbi:tetratricopeptide repeat protein [Streptomyces echinatus]|uniref:tetratricopeptide repeat protein n=1 Tax=Streptomyces echinatus TaxID=67293 RepID=UPI00378B639F
MPPLASAFQPRPGLRDRIDRAWAGRTSLVLTGGGGVGKSQLAAARAHRALAAGTEVVVWVNAADVAQVVTGYAAAALSVQADRALGEDVENDARVFLEWLAVTSRSWLVVLDDVTDMESLVRWWWPSSSLLSGGRVLATSRRRDALPSGGDRAVVDVGTYAPDEALAYLRNRFTDTGMTHLLDAQAPDLLRELGHLPLALSHAAAYMINEDAPCGHYLPLFTDQRSRLEALLPPEADTEGYGRPVAAALLLALDAVRRRDPAGVAAPALCLAAHLDPVGHPLSLWAEAAVTGYLSAHRGTPPGPPDSSEPAEVTARQARSALRLLHHYSLITWDSRDAARAVRMHALTARAARESVPAPELAAAVSAAADALAAIWPEEDHTDRDLTAVLRANTGTLTPLAGDLLWRPDLHPVLYRAGTSLLNAGLYAAAVTHWQRLVATAERLLGEEHPDTLAARGILTDSYRRAERIADAIALGERVAADTARLLGDDAWETTAIRVTLANCYQLAGRGEDAIALGERVVADAARLLGDDDPGTIMARSNLAAFYSEAGRAEEAVALAERVVADRERLLGEDDPHTLASRSILAGAYAAAGRDREAIALAEQVVADRERLLGEGHPTTLESRGNLAFYHQEAGRTGEAITLTQGAVADAGRLLGDSDAVTIQLRGNLAALYLETERVEEAITLGEQAVADSGRILGPAHPGTLRVRSNLADSYLKAGRAEEAVTLGESTVADAERLLGPDHHDTLTARTSLAIACAETGRLDEATALLDHVVAGYERTLGPDHPETLMARANQAFAYERTGRAEEATALLEGAIAERTVGPDHPGTMDVCFALAGIYGRTGRRAEAIALLERVADAAERTRGLDDPDTFATRVFLAVQYGKAWRLGKLSTVLTRMTLGAARAQVGKRRARMHGRRSRG